MTKRIFQVRLTRKGLARISLPTFLTHFSSMFSFTSYRPRTVYLSYTSFVHHNSMSFKKSAYDFSRGNIRIFGMGLEMSLLMRGNIVTIAAGIVALNIIYEGKVRMIHF